MEKKNIVSLVKSNENLKTYARNNDRVGRLNSQFLLAYGIDKEGEHKLYNKLEGMLSRAQTGEMSFEDIGLSLLEYLDLSFVNKADLIDYLKEVRKNAGGELYDLLSKLIKAINGELEAKPKTSYPAPQVYESIAYPFLAKEPTYIELKLYNQRLYSFNRAKDKDYFPTKSPEIDTSKFKDMGRTALADQFMTENFYKLKKQDIPALVQSVVNEYLTSQGVEPCAVEFSELALNEKSIQYGEYDPNAGKVIFNSQILEKFEEAKNAKNQTYALKLLTTAIHEARHRVQFSTLKTNEDKLGNSQRQILASLEINQSGLTHSQYLASADELDARNEAQEYIKELALKTGDERYMAYYNDTKEDEQSNGKAEVDKEIKMANKNIYSTNFLNTTKSLRKDKQKLYQILTTQNQIERED